MMLAGNIPKKFWPFIISHAAYLNNITSPARCDNTKTIFEVLFNRKADVRRIPPIGAFCAIYEDRRSLHDQSFGLTSKQGVFIGIGRYNKVLGYLITNGNNVIVTRQNITFDPQLYPFKLRPTTSPDWQTFYRLTNPNARGAATTTTPPKLASSPDEEYSSDESVIDQDYRSSPNDNKDLAMDEEQEQADDEHDEDNEEDTEEESSAPIATSKPRRTSKPPSTFKGSNYTSPPKPPRQPTTYENLWNSNSNHKQERLSWIGKQVSKHFPGHGIFKGKVSEYHYASDNYTIIYEDNDVERIPYAHMKQLVPGTAEHADFQANSIALQNALHTAINSSIDNKNAPTSWKAAMASHEVIQWKKAADEEMKNLRNLNCWRIIPKTDLAPGTPIMGSRWTFRYKTDSSGNLTRYRSRLVVKVYSQIQGINYFESFSPVASFVTIRTLFALTALPHFNVYQYDVQVAWADGNLFNYRLHRCLGA